jgi:allophanate hydrolase subunit 2
MRGRAIFFSKIFETSARADRMGISLSGPLLELPDGADIISDGACPGAVQVHGNLQPTILGADSQTAGGYVKIATVISADLPLVAQLAPGDRVRFSEIDLWQARDIYMKNEFRIRTFSR